MFMVNSHLYLYLDGKRHAYLPKLVAVTLAVLYARLGRIIEGHTTVTFTFLAVRLGFGGSLGPAQTSLMSKERPPPPHNNNMIMYANA